MLKYGIDFDSITGLSVALDILAAVVVVWWPFRARTSTDPSNVDESPSVRPSICGWQRIGIVFVVLVILVPIKLVPFAFLGVHAFGFIRIFYLTGVVAFPVVGLLILLRSVWRPRHTRPASNFIKGVAVLLIGCAGVGYYASYVEPLNVKLERPTLDIDPHHRLEHPIRVGILADIQTNDVTDYERNALAMLMDELPDFVLLPGDLFQGSAAETRREAEELVQLLQLLDAPAGSFFVTGDVDYRPRIESILRRGGVEIIDHELRRLSVKGTDVLLAGVGLKYRSEKSVATIRALESAPNNGAIKILMAHRPGVVKELSPASDIDLVVAGHTHGGQVVVPGFGPPITLSVLPRAIAAGGLHRVDGYSIYISRGVGCERGQSPRLRFWCPPELTLLTIE